ncbi:TatD family hydrolase [Corynebacterium epidermidicanis]|uniref:Mg-dependent DNase n=1 Tax=Corynebacterium epidermidicanis TaxID=1050174 RepID=A0A0G3GZ84_9CORY|nr:TatD family hydrolase [Corynebacterium epidermidicanis]AKK04107.1 Mg-dependent DNase [Corynebacterium epidermidicanis]
MLLDTHFHLDFLPADQRASVLSLPGISVVPQTVLPSTFGEVATYDRASLGFHPWWVGEDHEVELARFATHLPSTTFIGEIGLDFAPRHQGTAELQVAVLTHILELLRADGRDFVMSIHAVRAASTVLDLLEQAEMPGTPVFHWFSGSSDELTRLIDLGGYISINPRMLETKRGRAYARQVPAARLLLETDLPAQTSTADGDVGQQVADAVTRALAETLGTLVELRDDEVRDQIEMNQRRLYGDPAS